MEVGADSASFLKNEHDKSPQPFGSFTGRSELRVHNEAFLGNQVNF